MADLKTMKKEKIQDKSLRFILDKLKEYEDGLLSIDIEITLLEQRGSLTDIRSHIKINYALHSFLKKVLAITSQNTNCLAYKALNPDEVKIDKN